MFVFAEVDDDLFGAGVEHVEEVTMSAIEAPSCEIVDAQQSIQQIPNYTIHKWNISLHLIHEEWIIIGRLLRSAIPG